MKEILHKYLTILRKDRSRRKKLAGMLCVLSLVVIAAVAWQLRFVGIAKADEPSCGMEEHVHTEACIERRLICGLKEGDPEPEDTGDATESTEETEALVHHHSDECYEEVKTLHCDLDEHRHGEKCYEIRKTLDCDLEEHVHTQNCYAVRDVLVCTEDHEHTADCYEQQEVLVCGKQEHTHGDDCYKVEKILICDLPEHVHTDDCYTVEKKLACGMEEGQVLETEPTEETEAEETEPNKRKGHVHTEDCYEIVYICGKEEHTHTLDCYSNPDADVETYEDWEKTLPEEMGHTWGENVLKVAQSQMGYKESTRNFKAAEDGTTKMGYTRYGEWYGNPYGEWNTIFTSFCLRYAGISTEAIPRHAGAFAMSVKLDDMDLLEDISYTPAAGDIVFLQDEDQKNVNRTAIVASLGNMIVDDVKVPCITVIEGNRDGAVAPYKYELDDEAIQYYVSMAAAYDRAQELGIPMEELPERTPDAEETTVPAETGDGTETTAPAESTEVPETTAAPQYSEEELDEMLSLLLKDFSAAADDLAAAETDGNEETARAAKYSMDQLFDEIQNYYGQRYPMSGEADFVAYLTNNAEDAYRIYSEAGDKYSKNEESVPQESIPEEVSAEIIKLLDVLSKKAAAYEQAVADEDMKQARQMTEDMNLLYDQAKVLYQQQFADKAEDAFDAYLKETYPKAAAMLEDSEQRLNFRSLNAMLQVKLTDFDVKAEQCAKAMNVGDDEQGKNLKLDLDRIYLELKDLHAKRYPDAEEGSFDIFLNNNHSKAVKRYLAAVKAYPDEQLDHYVTFTDPVTGEISKVFTMQDGMEVDVALNGAVCFPVEEKADDLNAIETTANLETVASDRVMFNHTQAAAQGSESADGAEPENTETESADGGIMTPEEPAETEAAEDPTDNRWQNIKVNVIPVSQDAENAFVNFVSEKYPDAISLTMLGIQYQYNGVDLDIGGARASMTLLPNEFGPVLPEPDALLEQEEVMGGPVILNAPVVNFKFSAMEVADNRAQETAENLRMIVLEVQADGTVAEVGETELNGSEEVPAVTVDARTDSSYAAVTYAAPKGNTKPLDVPNPLIGADQPDAYKNNARAYPDNWGEKLKTVDGELIGVANKDKVTPEYHPEDKYDPSQKNLILRTDPYFIKKALEDEVATGFFGYETPGATLGYVLRNYNLFTFGDAFLRTVVGSSAVGGNAFYQQNQGGTGDGYSIIPNYAPTFIKGVLQKIEEKTTPDGYSSDLSKTHTGNLEIKVSVPKHKDGQPDVRFPTYLGTANIGFAGCSFNGSYSMINATDKQATPYYFSDDYIRFQDFYDQMMSKLTPQVIKGIPIIDKTGRDFEKDNYCWVPKSSSEPERLFLRMGHSYIIGDELLANPETGEGVQIILVPPDNYDFPSISDAEFEKIKGTPYEGSRKGADLALAKIETAVTCFGKNIFLPRDCSGISECKPSLQFCYGDPYTRGKKTVGKITNETLKYPDLDTGAELKHYIEHDSTSSTLFMFPNATNLSMGLHACHLVAPNATVFIPQSGDSYGCTIANELRSCSDLHVLPYMGKGQSVVNIPLDFKLEKMTKKENTDGTFTYTEPASGEVFKFSLDLLPAKCEGTVLQTKDPKKVTGFHFDGKNTGKNITFDGLLDSKGHLSDKVDITLTNVPKDDFEVTGGKLVYELKESKDAVPGFTNDETVYEIELLISSKIVRDNIDDWASAKSPKFYVTDYRIYKINESGARVPVLDNKVSFNNLKTGGYVGPELPNTGGIGVLPFIVTGLAFTFIPVFLAYDARRKERR